MSGTLTIGNKEIFSHSDATDKVTYGSGIPAGTIINVESFTKTDTSSAISANAWTNLGLEVTIHNVRSNSKILVSYIAHLSSTAGAYQVLTRLQRMKDPDGSPITNDIAFGNNANYATASGTRVNDSATYQNNTNTFLDTPSFAGSIKYRVLSFTQSGGPNIYLNRANQVIAAAQPVVVSTITVMEVEA